MAASGRLRVLALVAWCVWAYWLTDWMLTYGPDAAGIPLFTVLLGLSTVVYLRPTFFLRWWPERQQGERDERQRRHQGLTTRRFRRPRWRTAHTTPHSPG